MIKIAIVGGTGYTGVELLRLLAQHPQAKVDIITSRAEAGKAVVDMFPSLRGHCELAFSEPNLATLLACDLIFFATPHGVAQGMMADLVAGGVRIVDLSADFRIKDISTWEKWYGQQHLCPELVETAVYGLPEANRDQIRQAQLVACPGCYPTAIQLGLLPLLESNLIDPQSLIANAASGVSGAGRQATLGSLMAEAGESFKAYGASGHRHLPEIEQGLRALQPRDVRPAEITFVPHLLPTIRGIHATLYARLTKSSTDHGTLQDLFETRFRDEPFVDVLPAGWHPETKSVRSTNICRIAVAVPQERDTVVVMSAIDNLTKGASGQAIQNMNIMFGLDESLGLRAPGILP